MGQISLRKIQFAAFLYDASPQATKAREKAGVRKLVMLVSDRLAQTHSVDKFRTFEQNDMCELIADALFSQEEFPPESLEFCELISIVSELEKGFRAKDPSNGELQQPTTERSRTFEAEEGLEGRKERLKGQVEEADEECRKEEDEECLEEEKEEEGQGQEDEEERQEGSVGSTGKSGKPEKRHNSGLTASKSFQASPQMTDFDMDGTPGVGLHSVPPSKDHGCVAVQPGREQPNPSAAVQFYRYMHDSSPQTRHVFGISSGLPNLAMWVSQRLAETHDFDEFRTYGRDEKMRLIIEALDETPAKKFPLGMQVFSQLIFVAKHLDPQSTGGWHSRPLMETTSFQAAPQRARFNIYDVNSLSFWVYAQMHARQMLIRRPSLVAKNTASSQPFPGVTYESTLYKQLKTKNLAGNGKTFLANVLDIWRAVPDDKPAFWRTSGTFGLIRKLMSNTYASVYTKVDRRAKEPGLHPARDADKENAAPSALAAKNSTGVGAGDKRAGTEVQPVLKRPRTEPGPELQHRSAEVLQIRQ